MEREGKKWEKTLDKKYNQPTKQGKLLSPNLLSCTST